MDAITPVETSTTEAKGKPTSKGKGKGAKKASGPKRSLNLSLPVDDYERFVLHAMRMTGGNISELVCRLGREHLREYHLSRNGARTAAGSTLADSHQDGGGTSGA